MVDEANNYLSLHTFFLGAAVRDAIDRFSLVADDFADQANRTGLFRDDRLLREGFAAWIAEDHIKAAHVLVPQVEAGFRSLAGRLGRPTTKAHRVMKQARVVTTFGDLLDVETAQALGAHGSNLVLHMRALYADPRGHNLRNDLAHGLASPDRIHSGILMWVVHSLLLIGAWLIPDATSDAS